MWVAGVAGMIISSVNGNNNGWVVTCGCATAVAALCVFAATAATRRDRIDVFEDADAERRDADGGSQRRAEEIPASKRQGGDGNHSRDENP